MSDTKLVRAATLDWFGAVVDDIEGVHLRISRRSRLCSSGP